jgi:hypothetical protein
MVKLNYCDCLKKTQRFSDYPTFACIDCLNVIGVLRGIVSPSCQTNTGDLRNMLKKFIPVLLCTAAPAALLAQQVELKSSDGFISVEGEIIGFNGVMLSIETSVGQVSVPASEVICFGSGCAITIANNNFGLTEASFDGVVSEIVVAVEDVSDDYVISFEAPDLNVLYRTIAGAFAVANQTGTSADLTVGGDVSLQNEAGNETATMALAEAGAASDLRVSTVSLRGSAQAVFSGPVGWATATQLPNQMVGMNAFAVVASPNVGVDAVSMDQLAAIYAGELTNWSQLGGADIAILPLQMPVNSAVRNEMIELVMEPTGKSIATNVLTMADEAGLAASVNQFVGSVSVVSVDGAQDNKVLAVSGSCGTAVAATPFNIVSGDYPLVRPIMVTYDRTPNTSLLTELFDFAATDISQNLIEREGFISHNGIMQESAEKNARLSGLLSAPLDDIERPVAAQMFQILFEAERLSPTVSGGVSSGPESAWNRAMLRDLAELLSDAEYVGKELIIAGFGASVNGSEAAIAASAQAASEVQAAFTQFAPDLISVSKLKLSPYGFGNVSPATCYEGQVSGPSHSRVEFWVR